MGGAYRMERQVSDQRKPESGVAVVTGLAASGGLITSLVRLLS